MSSSAVEQFDPFEKWNVHQATPVNAKKVLVVEDDPFWQQVIRRNLEKAAKLCAVTFVTSAEEAVTRLSHDHSFHLIIADQFLDGESTGYDLWRNCQKRGIQIPFLLTSGNTNFPEEFVRDKPLRFVAKPFVAAEIREMLADLLNGDLGKNYFTISPAPWVVAEEKNLDIAFLLAVAALLALAVSLAATQSPLGGVIWRPLKTIAPPPAQDLYNYHPGDMSRWFHKHFITRSNG